MMRACETAAAVFGEAISGAGENAALLMKRQDEVDVERSEHDGIALPAGLDYVSEELAREQLGKLLHAILHSYVRTPLAVVLPKLTCAISSGGRRGLQSSLESLLCLSSLKQEERISYEQTGPNGYI